MNDYYRHVASEVNCHLDSSGNDNITIVFFDGEDTHSFVVERCQALWLADALKLGAKFKKKLVDK